MKSWPVTIVVGLNFMEFPELRVDFVDRTWKFKEEPQKVFEWEVEENTVETCCGQRELILNQAVVLKKFLNTALMKIPEKPGLTNLTAHVIDIEGHPPINQRHYLFSPWDLEAQVLEVDQMLANDIIEPSKSGLSSPIVMVRKPEQSYR